MLAVGSGYVVGEFRCRAGDERWRSENWIGPSAHVVLPGPAVAITQRRGREQIATACDVVLYNPDTTYRRRLLDHLGDHAVYVELSPELADELGRFGTTSAPLAAIDYVRLRALTRRVPDPLVLDELVLAVLAPLSARRPADDDDEIARRVKDLVASQPEAPHTLASIGAALHYSPYHLARLFRRQTGMTISCYRTQLRVRLAALRVIDGGAPLAAVATDLGFASHSHLTTAFSRVLGLPPRELQLLTR